MRSKPSTASIGLAAYVGIVLATATAAFLPNNPNAAAYLVLLVLTLPVSLIAYPVLFVTIGVTFSDSGSVWLRLLTIALWMAFVAVELVALREIRRARRHPLTG
jgi:hypothetical protein